MDDFISEIINRLRLNGKVKHIYFDFQGAIDYGLPYSIINKLRNQQVYKFSATSIWVKLNLVFTDILTNPI